MANAFDSINALLAYKDGKIAEFKERAENAEIAVRALKRDVFNHAELVLLDLAVMERLTRTKEIAPPENEASGDDKLLWQHIRKLEALHQRLDALIEQAKE